MFHIIGFLLVPVLKGFDNKRSKHVICIETQEIYGSLHEAATKTGFDRKSLQQACEGKAKYVHGYHFAFWPIDIRPKEELNIKKGDKMHRIKRCVSQC